MFTFKLERNYKSPTENIKVNDIKIVKSDETSSSNCFVRLHLIYFILFLFFRKLN